MCRLRAMWVNEYAQYSRWCLHGWTPYARAKWQYVCKVRTKKSHSDLRYFLVSVSFPVPQTSDVAISVVRSYKCRMENGQPPGREFTAHEHRTMKHCTHKRTNYMHDNTPTDMYRVTNVWIHFTCMLQLIVTFDDSTVGTHVRIC